MKKNSTSRITNTLLVEIVMVFLFFALCTAFLLQVMTASRAADRRIGATENALSSARQLAEKINAGYDPEQLLTEAGYTTNGSGWKKAADDVNCDVTLTEEKNAAGTLTEAQIVAYFRGEKLFILEAAHYTLRGEI